MSDQPTKMIDKIRARCDDMDTEQASWKIRIQRFFEDWWPVFAIAAALFVVFAVGIQWLTTSSQPDMTYCNMRHGHAVQTGIGDQLACVDDAWVLVTP